MRPGAQKGHRRGLPEKPQEAARALRWALWLVRRGCSAAHAEEVEGDLLEVAELHGAQRLSEEPSSPRRPRWVGIMLIREALSAARARPSARLRQSAHYGVLLLLATGLAILLMALIQGNPEPPMMHWLLGLGVTLELCFWYLALRGPHHE